MIDDSGNNAINPTPEQLRDIADTLEEWCPLIHREVAKKAARAVTEGVAILRAAADAQARFDLRLHEHQETIATLTECADAANARAKAAGALTVPSRAGGDVPMLADIIAFCERSAVGWDTKPRSSYERGYGAACNNLAGLLKALPIPTADGLRKKISEILLGMDHATGDRDLQIWIATEGMNELLAALAATKDTRND